MLDNYYAKGCRSNKTIGNKSNQQNSSTSNLKYPLTNYFTRQQPSQTVIMPNTQRTREPKQKQHQSTTNLKSARSDHERIQSLSPRDVKLNFLKSSLFGRSQEQYKHLKCGSIQEQEKHVTHIEYAIENVPHNIDLHKMKKQLNEQGMQQKFHQKGIHVTNLNVQFSPTPCTNKSQGRIGFRQLVDSKSCSPDIVIKNKLEQLGMVVKEPAKSKGRTMLFNYEQHQQRSRGNTFYSPRVPFK